MVLAQLVPDPARTVVPTSGGPEWWEILSALAPVAILLAAIITGFIGWKSLRHSQRALAQEVEADRLDLEQRSLADRKAQWWDRVQWALDAAFSDDDVRKAAGIAMIRVLSQPEWLTAEELLLLDAAWRDELESEEPAQTRSARLQGNTSERRAKVEAARLRVALDRRLDRTSPEWVSTLARENVRPD